MPKRLSGVLLVPVLLAGAPSVPPPDRFQPMLDKAFARLYSSDYDGAQSILDQYIGQHPGDPVAYSVKASGYLFGELERMGILEADFFESDKKISDKKKQLHADPQVKDRFYAAIGKAREIANNDLTRNANDANALFALCLAAGDLTDYMALIEKRQVQSLSVNKDGYRDAKRLLQVAPDYYDAYMTTGFTEYLIGSIPAVFRWFVRFDDVQGSKEQGVHRMEIVAKSGHYLKGFAKIMLATAYLREKKLPQARDLLRDFNQTYPQNALLKRELDRLSARM